MFLPLVSGRRKAPNAISAGGVLSRRSAIAGLMLGAAFQGTRSARAQTTSGMVLPSQEAFPWQRLLGDLSIASGTYQGAYRSTPAGPISWYFANIGLWFFVDAIPDSVRAYLNAYLRSLNPVYSTIQDVAADLVTQTPPDSNDAYAGTFLRLAVQYARKTGDSAWWSANIASLKKIAYSNILTQIKPNGLVRAFQAPAANGIGYLMDQCEAYAGLRDFGQYLLDTNDSDSSYFSGFAPNLGIAIHGMYDYSQTLWNWCDVASPQSNAWYPNLTAQIYPHLYDVHSNDAVGDYTRLLSGYIVLDSAVPDWTARPQDLYPWLVVGYYAASCLKRTDLALEMLGMVRKYYLPGSVNTGHFLVSEIGYVAGIEQAAASMASPAICSAGTTALTGSANFLSR